MVVRSVGEQSGLAADHDHRVGMPPHSAEFLEEERREMGEWWYMQEYFGVFMDAQSAAFRSEDIARAFAEEIEVWSL